MIKREQNKLRVEIPISSVDELVRYQRGLLHVLKRIHIDECDVEFKNDLAAVYELLSHILIEKDFPYEHEEILNHLNSK